MSDPVNLTITPRRAINVTVTDGAGNTRLVQVGTNRTTVVALSTHQIGNLSIQTATDVDMTQAADGAALVWRSADSRFEAVQVMRNLNVDAGNF